MIHENLRKCIATLLAVVIFGMLSACSKNPGSNAQNSQTTQTNISQRETTGTPSTELNTNISTDENGTQETSSILITYFAVAENSEVDAVSSASVREVNGEAKGNIRVLADVIQSNVGGEMFSILTSTKYPAGVNSLIDYADKEQEENIRPELTSHIEKLDDFDVIFIGYPNWWYDMPMVLYSFFEEYDFSDKIIVPFCTHNGSGFSGTINTIKELEPNATVLEGFTINGRNVEDVSSDVAEWISGLEL